MNLPPLPSYFPVALYEVARTWLHDGHRFLEYSVWFLEKKEAKIPRRAALSKAEGPKTVSLICFWQVR